MIKYIFTALIIANVGFCTPDCGDRIPIESSLPEDVSGKIPYQNIQSVTFKHNLGKEINYSIKRFSGREETSQCDACCTQIIYDFEKTNLVPNYPTFEMEVSLESYDSASFSYVLIVGNSIFNMNNEEYFTLRDSVNVGGNYFKEVYKMKNRNHDSEQGVYPDSVYYNFSQGFLKIIMSNNEFYEVQ